MIIKTDTIAGCKNIASDIYKELGYGFEENIYQSAFEVALQISHIKYEPLRKLDVHYRGYYVGYVISDLIVYGVYNIVVELKTLPRKLNIKEVSQIKRYMGLTKINKGLLVNFCSKPIDGKPEYLVVTPGKTI